MRALIGISCRTTLTVLLATFNLFPAAEAAAAVTLFTGVSASPANRPVRGFGAGLSLIVLGFEFEYADTSEDALNNAPSLQTTMFNVLVHTPFPVSGLQFYGTTGGGLYREQLGGAQKTHVGVNFGGGVKITLTGPLRARIDYRVFTLRGKPVAAHPQRIYVGLNLGF